MVASSAFTPSWHQREGNTTPVKSHLAIYGHSGYLWIPGLCDSGQWEEMTGPWLGGSSQLWLSSGPTRR